MIDEREQLSSLIERLLADPALRRRFRAEPAQVLAEHGLQRLAADLPSGGKAMMTLELRESRSSLAGVMIAGAAEGVDFIHMAEHALPALEHQAGAEFNRLLDGAANHHHHARPSGGRDNLELPPLAQRTPPAGGPAAARQPTPALPSPARGQARTPLPQTGQQPASAAGAGAQHTAGHHPLVLEHHHHHHRLAYPGDDASPQRIATWMARHAARAGLPPELPIMAALTESGLRNLPYGDRDSVGFFQMRLGIWDNGTYAGYPTRPALQLKWFIDQALAVRAADPSVAESPASWGTWVADVEQPAAEFRGRYQLQLDAARELLRGVDLTAAAAPNSQVPVDDEALQVAMRYLGTPYQWGGSSPATGFDCSGLVQYAYSRVGIELPRVAADQFHVGVPVPRADLQPGDAVFFADPSGYVHHVGLYVGHGRFINAPETGEDVKISSLSDPYFAAEYAGARRYAPAGLSNPSNYARTLPVVRP